MLVIITIFAVAWLLAAGAGTVIWRYSEDRWTRVPRILVASFAVALLAAPGLAIGHGVAPMPALLVLVFQPRVSLYTAIIPLGVTWLFTLLLFSTVKA